MLEDFGEMQTHSSVITFQPLQSPRIRSYIKRLSTLTEYIILLKKLCNKELLIFYNVQLKSKLLTHSLHTSKGDIKLLEKLAWSETCEEFKAECWIINMFTNFTLVIFSLHNVFLVSVQAGIGHMYQVHRLDVMEG